MKEVRFLGLDVHAETIAVAIAEPTGYVLYWQLTALGVIVSRRREIVMRYER